MKLSRGKLAYHAAVIGINAAAATAATLVLIGCGQAATGHPVPDPSPNSPPAAVRSLP